MNELDGLFWRRNQYYYTERLKGESFRKVKKTVPHGMNDSEAYMVRKQIGKRIITYYVDRKKEFLSPDRWTVSMDIGRNCIHFWDKICVMGLWYTESSIHRALVTNRYYCALYDRRKTGGKYEFWIHTPYDDTYTFRICCSFELYSSKWTDAKEQEIVEEVLEYADGIVTETIKFHFNTSLLEKIPHSSDSQIPDWLSRAVKIGGIVIAKTAIRAIGAEIDIPMGDSDSSSIPDFDFGDSGMSDFTVVDSDYLSNIDYSDYDTDTADSGYNISFTGKDTLPPNANSDGYIPKGSISLERLISGKSETFKLYNKGGSDYVLYNGSYIKLSGNTVTIANVKYKC